jgi:hypothetical protein
VTRQGQDPRTKVEEFTRKESARDFNLNSCFLYAITTCAHLLCSSFFLNLDKDNKKVKNLINYTEKDEILMVKENMLF